MKKLKINAFLFLGLLFTFISCEKDLDVEPKDERLLKDDAFYKRPGAYKQALAGVYGNLSLTGAAGPGDSFLVGVDAGTSQYGRCLLYLQDLTTDEMVWSYENDPGTADLQRNIWTKSNPILLGMFSRIMAEVAFVNEF